MIKSMTGYGKGETNRDGYRASAEIKTVNHRYTNVYLHMPGYLSALETSLQKLIKGKVDRGRIDLYLKIEEDASEILRRIPEINHELVQRYHEEFKSMQDHLGYEQGVSLDTLITLPDVINLKEAEQDEEILHDIILETVNKSLDSLLQMRLHEGEELARDLQGRLERIEEELAYIKEREPQALEEYKNRMRERIKELLEDKVVDEYRLAMEIAVLAERTSINEEVVRLKSHLGQFGLTLKKDEAIGRKLDFIAQEMYREANTIGSKTIDPTITNAVVNIKSEIDKIREQVQNIE